MMMREPTREMDQQSPEQPTLPFEESTLPLSDGEPSGVEMDPREVWKALPEMMRAEVRRGCLRAMREVVGDAPQ